MIQNKRLLVILLSVTGLLTIPLIAMQFTSDVNWTLFDFMVAGVLLFSTGLTIELLFRTVRSRRYRLLLCGVVLAVLFLVWAELAVGIFGTRFAGS